MTELIERYVHQVGRYVPPRERAEIEAELRSQIQDQLDDRFAGSPSDEEVASILAEFGHPYQIATAYNSERYLVGPTLYPFMMLVLRRAWLLVPIIVIFLNIFGALVSAQPVSISTLLIDTVIAVLQLTLIFSAVVILLFALIQHYYVKIDAEADPFNPLELPKVDDPRAVDRLEAIFGMATGTIVTLAFIYFLRVGGLILPFNLSAPNDVIPVPMPWLILFIIMTVAMVIVEFLAWRRNRWDVALWLIETVLETIGVFCLYFVLYQPVLERVITTNPALADQPLIVSIPKILAVLGAVLMLANRGNRLIRLWNYRTSDFVALTTKNHAK